METPSSNALLRPRIRLHRHTPGPRTQESSDMDFTPVAGPSAPSQFNIIDEEDDNQPTPRMPLKAIPSSLSSYYGPDSDFGASTSSATPSDTPAARLRALLARSSDSPDGKYPPTRSFAQPVEAGIGTVPSRFTPATPSIIRDSLKDLFSHARREPGDTPQKSRQRRSSFDSSEMDITPVVGREREQHKGKRKSLSDDEVDKPKSSKGSESSLRSSHATTFDTLRARLMSSRSQLLDERLPTAVYDVSSHNTETGSLHSGGDGHANADSVALLQPLDSTLSLPPINAGSPHATFQLPSVSHSNLLDRDSEMQHAMSGVYTSEDEPVLHTKGVSTTPLQPRSTRPFRGSLRSHDQLRRTSLELPSSTLSNINSEGQQHPREEERKHQREREWNRPKVLSRPATPELQHRHSLELNRRRSQEIPRTSPSHVKSLSHEVAASRSGSPLSGRNLQRRGSVTSLRSFDDDRSSRPSSMSSQADYRDRMAELDRDRYIEREREWNKRHPPPRPSSSLSSSSSHSHTHPARPPSATAYSTPTHASLQRQASNSSLNRPSGASSPASSLGSRGSQRDPEDEDEREVSHERERNWNSPHPKWATARHRNQLNGNEVSSGGAHLSWNKIESSRSSSLASGIAKSGLTPARAAIKKNGIFSSGNFASSTPAKGSDEPQFTKSHRRRSAEYTESIGTILPPASISGASNHEDVVLASDEESVSGFIFASTTPDTPLERSQEDAPSEAQIEVSVSPPRSPPKQQDSLIQSLPNVSSNDEARLRRALASTSSMPFRSRTPEFSLKTSPAQESTTPPSFTPPGTPPLATTVRDGSSSEPTRSFTPTTPPRRLSSSTSILSIRTPSPPHDLSNLSILPSSSEDEEMTREADVTPVRVDEDNIANPNSTAMKTPRPPGAWAFTPVPSRHVPTEASSPPSFSEPNMTASSSSSSTHLSRVNSEPERHSKPEPPTGNGLLTPIPSLSRANSLPLRTPAPPGAWMSTPNQPSTQNGSIDQSQFGSVGKRKSILKVRFDVAESEASTAEVEHSEAPLPAVRTSTPYAESVLSEKTCDSTQDDVIYEQVRDRPATPERPMTSLSLANALSPRSQRKSPSVKVVDAFGREKVDEDPIRDVSQDIPNGHMDTEEASHLSSPAEALRKSNIRIVDAMGREIEEDDAPVNEPSFDETSSALHGDRPLGRAETLSQMRQTLRELADELSDGDRSADDLALNTNHLEELEEVSRAARHARNQLAQTLCVESVRSRDLMHKYVQDSANRNGRISTIIGDNGIFHRGLIWLGVVVQIIFVLAMWRFAHVQARRLFYTIYYDPLYPELNPLPGQSHRFLPPYPSFSWSLSSAYELLKHEGWIALKAELQDAVRRIGDRAWERWGERPYAGTWPPS